MSIRIPILQLPVEHRSKIIDELQFDNPNNNKLVQCFVVDEKNDEVCIPFAYAKTVLGLVAPKRDVFSSVRHEFKGELRDYQIDVRSQTIQQLNSTGSCILSLHVGWGKSMFSVYLACKLKFKTLIVVNRLVLIEQWKELIEQYCSSTCQVLRPKQKVNDACGFYIINAQNIPKMHASLNDIGCVIVDEIHLICAQTLFKSLLYLHPRYLIGLSATPRRPDGLEILLDLFFGKHKIIKTLHRKHIVYAVHTNIKIKYELQWDGKMDWNSVLTNQAENDYRNSIIKKIISKFSDRYFLVLCKRISQGEKLKLLLEEANERVTDLLGTKHSFDTEARIVIATTQKCGVGFSHDKLDALLLASDVEEYFIQYLGRVFRTPDVEPIVFDLIDDLPVLKRHFNTRKRVYKDSGGIIKETGSELFLI